MIYLFLMKNKLQGTEMSFNQKSGFRGNVFLRRPKLAAKEKNCVKCFLIRLICKILYILFMATFYLFQNLKPTNASFVSSPTAWIQRTSGTATSRSTSSTTTSTTASAPPTSPTPTTCSSLTSGYLPT